MTKTLNFTLQKILTTRLMDWYLNNHFIGETKSIHEIEISPRKGKYTITVVDEFGYEIKQKFEIKD